MASQKAAANNQIGQCAGCGSGCEGETHRSELHVGTSNVQGRCKRQSNADDDSKQRGNSGIYFEDRQWQLPLPENCTRKRIRQATIEVVEGKAMAPPPALYHDERLKKKVCTEPLSAITQVKCLGINHNATTEVNHRFFREDAGFRDAALALTALCGRQETPTRNGYQASSIMQPPPRLPNTLL